MAITNLTNTTWTFNEELPSSSTMEFSIDFITNDAPYKKLKISADSIVGLPTNAPADYMTTPFYSGKWLNNNYRVITIKGGADVENADLIAFLQANATETPNINLAGTTWVFRKTLPAIYEQKIYNIDFVSNGSNFIKLTSQYSGYTGLYYSINEENNIQVVGYDGWSDSAYRTITITGGDDINNADLLSFLEQVASRPLEFTETKTALKIYEDLSQKEYDDLNKDTNSFYLVNDVGVYKGNKLIATSIDSSSYQRRLDKPSISNLNLYPDDIESFLMEAIPQLREGQIIYITSLMSWDYYGYYIITGVSHDEGNLRFSALPLNGQLGIFAENGDIINVSSIDVILNDTEIQIHGINLTTMQTQQVIYVSLMDIEYFIAY